jgi:hypothetical protein
MSNVLVRDASIWRVMSGAVVVSLCAVAIVRLMGWI